MANIEWDEDDGTAYRFMRFMEGRAPEGGQYCTSAELRNAGLYSSDVLQLMIDRGVIERIDTGFYRLNERAYAIAAWIRADENELVAGMRSIGNAHEILLDGPLDVRHPRHWGQARRHDTSDGYPYGWDP